MVPNVGILEIAIVLVIALIVFGPKRLPELGKSLGRGISEFKEGISSIGDSVTAQDDEDDDEPVELTAPSPRSEAAAAQDPEVTEVQPSDTRPEAEQVDGEVVAERRD
jgi:sec-independent protein translocase protein TatA